MIDIDELISVITQLQKAGRRSIVDDAVGAIKQLDTQLSAFKRMYNEASVNLQYAEAKNKTLLAALQEIQVTAAMKCDCQPAGGLYACEIHRTIAEEALNE